MKIAYKRILLKLSGEALAGEKKKWNRCRNIRKHMRQNKRNSRYGE